MLVTFLARPSTTQKVGQCHLTQLFNCFIALDATQTHSGLDLQLHAFVTFF
jgi:hypothetical protein